MNMEKPQTPHNFYSFEFYHDFFKNKSLNCDIEEAKEKIRHELLCTEKSLGEKALGLQDIIDEIPETENLDVFISLLAQRVFEFIKSKFSLPELEEVLYNFQFNDRDNKPLNKLLYYSISFDRNSIDINVHHASSLSQNDKIKLVREGFRILAKELNEKTELKNVEKICAESWIVAKNPKLLELLGFKIIGTDKAEIARVEFLEKYLT